MKDECSELADDMMEMYDKVSLVAYHLSLGRPNVEAIGSELGKITEVVSILSGQQPAAIFKRDDLSVEQAAKIHKAVSAVADKAKDSPKDALEKTYGLKVAITSVMFEVVAKCECSK